VINWSLQLGLSLLKNVQSISEPWVAIMDHSIDIGVKKVLVVLRVKLSVMKNRESAITLKDCECIGLKVHEKSNGDIVAKDLKEIFNQAGVPAAVVKDGGGDLSNGVDLWKEQNKQNQVEIIEDVGHVVANAIKAQYAESKLFKLFLAIINRCARQLRQTTLAFLTPPKLRSKGRYQGISIFAKWSVKILELFNSSNQNQEFKKLRISLLGLSQLKTTITSFAQTVLTSAKIMELLKNKGLNNKTYEEAMSLTESFAERSPVKKKLIEWLNKHIQIQTRLGIDKLPLIVSSDIIESLFGKYKNIQARGSMIDMNRTVLLIPALCGRVLGEQLDFSTGNVSNQELAVWDTSNIPYTQNRKRRDFLAGKPLKLVPKTGGLHSQIE
jgi:hypothetical protein